MPKRKKNMAKILHELEYETGRKTSAERTVREAKLATAKDKQTRKNRKNEWTVFWQGGAPQ